MYFDILNCYYREIKKINGFILFRNLTNIPKSVIVVSLIIIITQCAFNKVHCKNGGKIYKFKNTTLVIMAFN